MMDIPSIGRFLVLLCAYTEIEGVVVIRLQAIMQPDVHKTFFAHVQDLCVSLTWCT